jgi:uncharacterized FlaG/YvyC family protein
MASDGNPVTIPATRLLQGSQGTIINKQPAGSGKPLPPGGKATAAAPPPAKPAPPHPAAEPNAVQPPVVSKSASVEPAQQPAPAKAADSKAIPAKPDLQPLVAQLNKYLNDSGRPNQYRVVSSSGSQVIQEVNPANGEVVGEFSASEFPALAKGLGAAGILIDSRA